MRIFVVGAEGVIGARLAAQFTGHGHQVIGTRRSPRNAGRVRGLSAEPAAVGQPARAAPQRGGFLMPIGYLWTVAVVCWGVACALTRWRGSAPSPPSPRWWSANCRSSPGIC